jgi:hypothetical protein
MLLATATLFQKLSQAPIRRVRHRIPCCRGYEWWYSVGTSVPESPHTGIQPQGTALNHRPLRGGLMNQENLPFPTRSPAGPAVRYRNYAQRQQPNRLPEDGPCPLIAVADGAVPPSLSCGGTFASIRSSASTTKAWLQRVHPTAMCPPTLASLPTGPDESAG